MLKKKDKKLENPEQPLTESELIDRYVDSLAEKERQALREQKPSSRKGRAALFAMLAVVALAAAALMILYFTGAVHLPGTGVRVSSVVTEPDNGETDPSLPAAQTQKPDADSSATPDSETAAQTETRRPTKLFGAAVTPDTDYQTANTAEEFGRLVDEAESNGLTTLFVRLNGQTGSVLDSEAGKTSLNDAVSAAHQKAISVFGLLDLSQLTEGDITDPASLDALLSRVLAVCETKDLDGIMLTGLARSPKGADFADYIAAGTLSGYKRYSEDRLTALVQRLSEEIRQKNGAMLLGLVCDSVYATAATRAGGMEVKCDSELLRDQNADVLFWMEQSYFDIVFVTADTTTASSDMPFEAVVDWWSKNTPASCDLGFMLSSDLAMAGKDQWKNPDQLTRQLMALNQSNRYVFCFNSYAALKNDTSGGAKLLYKYLTGGIANDYVLTDLTFTSPTKRSFTTYENTVLIIGASDPNFDLTMNGNPVERTEYGYFSLQLSLKIGKNTFTFTHKGSSETFTITYRYVVLKDYSPSSAVTLDGGSTLVVRATARTGSTVKATLNGSTVTLQNTEGEEGSDFSAYVGSFELPGGYSKDTKLGKVTFTGTCNGVTERFTGGAVTVRKEETFTPGHGGYIGVGNTLIAEVAKYQVETFDGNTVDDLSQPYNSYLPLGTVDYCSEKTIYDPKSQNSYRLLRYGKRVYTVSKGVTNVKTYRGSLPGTNKLSVKSVETSGSHTVLTLKTDWKAPFKVELLPQKYRAATDSQRGAISSVTFQYIDITFCYASSFSGSLEELASSPVFSKAQVIKNTSDYTLRLYLKKTGAFYGWTADYDKSGNLVFKFLNPRKAQKASNAYGGRLDGITVVVDAGHGGRESGAVGSIPTYDEANRNLVLAQMIEKKLKSIGATVVMTRTADVTLTFDERILKVKNASPDLAVSVHRNASETDSKRGFNAYHFNAYTKLPAEKINTRMAQKGTYTSTGVLWHFFYLSRISDCPVVLTENGYMSNKNDFNNMMNDSWNDKCADAIVAGIVDYFLSIG